MNRYMVLLKHDLRNMARDPLLLFMLIGPLLLILAVRTGSAYGTDLLQSAGSFDLLRYTDLITVFMMLLIPILIGTMTGLFILDERDEQLIGLYAVTPIRKQGYFLYRLALPTLLGLAMSTLFLLAGGVAQRQFENMGVLGMLALEAPIFALFLATAAANKVEGLALSKIVSLTLIGAIVAYFAPEPWQLLAVALPTYWPSKLYLEGASVGGDLAWTTAALVTGFLYHLLILYVLLRRFLQRID
ncbi:hypothetical protein B1A99_19165 [Cohnella sp. CIP 111063]|uniref:hypothetical protein n=1 Tax=unclassified Cohnella TaxID=2636738 RepID=UPI000B8BDF94|nr:MULTISPECIES: hypothetical protein [unclassified Cohnella]OXS56971.1 hypothetical protein B1A99_19165 [Cohnella sp. CIP 111063]PRX69823.1 fluoroquinolone transport system permease protein [Cohnella sp. SGD-V74]